MSEEVDLPYRSEYAKSNRSSCKGCKEKIEKGELRLAVMVQSPMFDGKTPNWHHVKCFFGRNRPKAVGDIAHFDNLRWEDQEKITKMVNDALAGVGPSGKAKGGKSAGKSGGGVSKYGTIMGDFRVEIAKAGGAGCRVCEIKIKKGLARIGKKDYESQRAKMYGPYDRWHHVGCFSEKREELEFFDAGEDLAGFKTLGVDDQKEIKEKLPALKVKRKSTSDSNGKSDGEPDAKKSKMDDATKEKLKKQMKKMYYYRDMLEKLSKNELVELLEHNDQEVPVGNDRMLDRLSDIMLLGALEKCSVCKEGQFVFKSGVGYACTGNISEWTKCQERTDKPKRKEFKLPAGFKDQYDFLKLYKFRKVEDRILQHNQSTVRQSSQESNSSNGTNGTSSQKSGSQSSMPLKNLTFVLEGKSIDKDSLKSEIEKLGGRVIKKVTETTAAVISDKETLEAKKLSKNIQAAKDADIQVVSADLFEDFKTKGVVACIKDKTISDWGAEPKDRIGSLLEKAQKSSIAQDGSSMFTADMPKSMKLKLKGGAYVDPESGLEHKAHVLKRGNDLYSVVLGAVNIQTGMNSYYKLQLLQHDNKHKWYVFRSWGRVGTTIGGTKLEDYDEKEDALQNFMFLYEDKTGNSWRNHKNFVKKPGRFFPMDLDMGGDNKEIKKLDAKAGSNSKLNKRIQNLVKLIFDVDTMKKAMVEFEIDLNKMPLGKISKKQIESAYKVLTEAQDLINNNGDVEGRDTKFLDASNRFFTLIPHDFGMKAPPILNNVDLIKSKIDMLDSLLEIEVAYNLLQSEDEDKAKDPIDAHYDKLKTKMEVVDKKSEEFKMLETYVKNTHASTHTLYTLEIEDIFKIRRKGETGRFEPYKKLDNRMLLWHGSRVTNFAGILSQGLRIAPPEAPATGYMFGKGIYFADMVSKSANYCSTTKSNNTGLMLLCDVALGKMCEKTQADYVEKLPKGYHSTKGIGKTEPDPTKHVQFEEMTVPQGKGVKSETQSTALLYNEYIIYNVAQCNAKYLFRMKFNYNY